jgi:hypothetical protein
MATKLTIGPSKTLQTQGVSAIPFVTKVNIEFHPGKEGDSSSGADASSPELQSGVPSLFNPYAIVVFPSVGADYNKIIDGGSAYDQGARNGNVFSVGYEYAPTISSMVAGELSNGEIKLSDKMPYNFTDFLYCKWVGKIPNNQIITLRRYPAPTYDNLQVPATLKTEPTKENPGPEPDKRTINDVEVQPEFFPIAQAVTWFGEDTGNKLSEILSFTVNMNWKNVEAEVNTSSGNEQGSEDSPLPGVAKFLGILTGNVNAPFATANSQYDPYNGGPYSHRVYGPVNVIAKTYKRDRGLDFKQQIVLNFEYSLKSIGNINPKAAMLDLMSNMLALTYNNAAFWGGANRYFPQKPTYPFLGGKAGMNAWYKGDPAGFAKAVGGQVSDAANKVGDILAQLAEDPISALKNIAAGAAKLGMIEMGKGRAPSIVAMKALLTGEPVGEWHMVIGNPFDPIAQIGNLICTEAKFQFNDVIGADNFPTELKVTITVEHGRPRDAGDIQSIFNRGQGRIYYPPKGNLDILNTSTSTKNSTNDTSWSHGASKYAKTTASAGIFTTSESDFDTIIGTVRTTGAKLSSTGQRAWDLADKMFLRTSAGERGTGRSEK